MLPVNSLVYDVLPAQIDNAGGWLVDYSFLRAVAGRLDATSVSMEAIENVLLIATVMLTETPRDLAISFLRSQQPEHPSLADALNDIADALDDARRREIAQ